MSTEDNAAGTRPPDPGRAPSRSGDPGAPYSDGGVAEYVTDAAGRRLQIMLGHGVVVLVPEIPGAHTYEAAHAIALGRRIVAAGELAAAHAHRFPE